MHENLTTVTITKHLMFLTNYYSLGITAIVELGDEIENELEVHVLTSRARDWPYIVYAYNENIPLLLWWIEQP